MNEKRTHKDDPAAGSNPDPDPDAAAPGSEAGETNGDATADVSRILTASQILDMDDRPVKPLPVPEWLGSVFVRPMSLEEQIAQADFENSERAEGETEAARQAAEVVRFLVRVLVGPDARPIFNETDLDKLQKRHGTLLLRISNEAATLCGLDKKAVDDAEGNS